jgi:hypothetical protein
MYTKSNLALPKLTYLLVIAISASSCDPGVAVARQGVIQGKVDNDCIEESLKRTVSDVIRRSYISDGERNFHPGSEVIQFGYSDKSGIIGYNLDMEKTTSAVVQFNHSWGKLGKSMSVGERRRAEETLTLVSRVLEKECNIVFKA